MPGPESEPAAGRRRRSFAGRLLRISARIVPAAFGLPAAFVFLFGDSMIYHPMRFPRGFWDPPGLPRQDLTLVTSDGVSLHAWLVPAGPARRGAIIFFHGNAGNLTHRIEPVRDLSALRMDVLILDYRGYGRSEGSPSEEGLARDARAAYDYLTVPGRIAPDRIILYGESLGCAVAVRLASEVPVAGLVLQSPFTSIPDMVKHVTGLPLGWLLRSRYPSLERIRSLTLPKLVIHGDQDDVVPYDMGKRLYEAAPDPKEFLPIPNAGHNDLWETASETCLRRIESFLRRVLP